MQVGHPFLHDISLSRLSLFMSPFLFLVLPSLLTSSSDIHLAFVIVNTFSSHSPSSLVLAFVFIVFVCRVLHKQPAPFTKTTIH
ncbi:hypothetical protein BKA57DRAFT_451474 [Linnemannia elongata]|nr:hypothetical protein BKA57DRAFT_451474 [Linnemannia elongata]